MKLFLLSKENILLAQAEAETLAGRGKLIDNILFITTKQKIRRLAYTRMILELLFEASEKTIEAKIKRFNWNKVVKGSFALVYLIDGKEHSHSVSRKYGGMVYNQLKKPHVDLEHPKTKIIVLEKKGRLFIGIEEWENKEEFYHRRPSARPGQQPVTVLPKFARACVNLTGSTTSIYDPFCGVGGFLIEAGLLGLKAIGSDISRKMIYLSKKNLEHYKIKNYKLFRQDALEIDKNYDYIVTDPPYGRGSRVVGSNLYEEFIQTLEKTLKKRAVIIFPDYMHAEKLLKKSKLKIKGKYSVYIHKTLTREIFVLER